MRNLLLILALCLALPAAAADTFKEIRWDALVPKGWDPSKELRGLDLSKLDDADPRAMEALRKMRELWDVAPTEPSLAGAKVRLPGFVIPLEHKGEQTTELLLVPYFGACIHSPPPPANQIVHAVAAPGKTLGKLRSMDPMWVNGTLGIRSADTPWGKSGYRLTVDSISPYEEPKRKK